MRNLLSGNDFDDVMVISDQAPILLFKHSTACPISSSAYQVLQQYEIDRKETCPPIYVVRVIEQRSLSNVIAEQLHIEHRSPQVIVVENRKALSMISHYGIHEERLDEVLGIES